MTRREAIGVAGLLLGAAASVPFIERYRFGAAVSADIARLFANADRGVGPDQLHARWDGLPGPIRRYLRYAIREGAPATRTARLKHAGTFRPAAGGPWIPIEGEQYFAAAAPGFVWHATIRPMPARARSRVQSASAEMPARVRWNRCARRRAAAAGSRGSGGRDAFSAALVARALRPVSHSLTQAGGAAAATLFESVAAMSISPSACLQGNLRLGHEHFEVRSVQST